VYQNEMTRRCLLVIDVLNDFLSRWEPAKADRLVANTNELVGICRAADVPVIWVRQAFRPDLSDAFPEMRDKAISITIEGTWGAEIDARLDRRAADLEVVKKRYSAFFRTDLEETLSSRGVDEVILAGLNTHACIRMAAIDAYQRDLRVVIAADCIGSSDEEHAEVTMRYMDGKIARAMSNAGIEALLTEA